MLRLEIKGRDMWDEVNEVFIPVTPQTLELEHSLYSVSLWEGRHHKSFLSSDKTAEELLDYIRCMTLNNVSETVYSRLSREDITDIMTYINSKQTATTFGKENKTPSRKIITAEQIYFWMTQFNIPFECQYWHLDKLLTLIRVAAISSKPEKMSTSQLMSRNRALNHARRKRFNTRG